MGKKAIKRILIISFIIVIMTALFIPTTAENQTGLENLKFGLPFHFIEQNSYLTPPEEFFPYKTRLLDPWENPTDFNAINFILSYLTFVFLTGCTYYLVKFTKDRN